jgi:hypothetical protein
MTPQDITHGLVANGITQLEQFTLNPLKAPVILTSQTHHQSLNLPLRPWSSPWIALAVGPLETHQRLVPTEKRRRFHAPKDLAHRFERAPGAGFQFGTQHHQR